MSDDFINKFSSILNAIKNQNTWQRIQSYMHSRQVLHFRTSGKSGSFRGVFWKPFSHQYVRINGTIVPLSGGLPKVYTSGLVKAKLRSKSPTGKKRYKDGDLLMQNTGLLRNALLQNIKIDNEIITLSTPVKYAEHQNRLRPFNFFAQDEIETITDIINKEMLNGF